MSNQKQVKLSKLFRNGRFVGHALSVDGLLLSNQTSVVLPPTDGRTESVEITVTLTCTNDMVTDAPDIHLK
ncbi:hypothetical protein REJ27_003175 [Providencia rettgeri]|nr:hypothetical protein [Providencia rettgeri]MDT5429260.1 hypothetical protein [Providencia rettgeri]